MYMYYENEYGKVNFSFGGNSEINVTAIDGLGIVPKECSCVRFIGEDGQTTVTSSVGARTITISGDIKLSSPSRLSAVLKTLNFPGYLYMAFKEKRRRIYCNNAVFVENGRNRLFMRFSLQFTADYPYFKDFVPRKQYLYQRIKLIKTNFTMPCMFSRRENRAEVINYSEFACEPVLYIINTETSAVSGGSGYEILNKTTGQAIKLETTSQEGEIIVVDIPERTVTSNFRGNILTCLSEDTYLSDFWLEPGNNIIEAVNRNSGEQITAACEYSGKYIEAVF